MYDMVCKCVCMCVIDYRHQNDVEHDICVSYTYFGRLRNPALGFYLVNPNNK